MPLTPRDRLARLPGWAVAALDAFDRRERAVLVLNARMILADLRTAGLPATEPPGTQSGPADAARQRRALARATRSLLETYLAHSVGQEDLAAAHAMEATDALARFARDNYRLPHH